MHSCRLHNSPSDAVVEHRHLRDLVRNVPWLAQLPEDELEYLLTERLEDLRGIMRRHPGDGECLKAAITGAMRLKPERHHFTTEGDVQIVRFMNMTGG